MVKVTLAALALIGFAGHATAQERPQPKPLAVGAQAPAFSLPAATKDGVSPKAASLADFRGQTVVLAFFPKARTGG
ncbi:MAG: redoxin domain-containing protein [Gemmatimonadetes bacterium]|nr:redoxin domain-containing protein [Gemmatimonadota bacterium]